MIQRGVDSALDRLFNRNAEEPVREGMTPQPILLPKVKLPARLKQPVWSKTNLINIQIPWKRKQAGEETPNSSWWDTFRQNISQANPIEDFRQALTDFGGAETTERIRTATKPVVESPVFQKTSELASTIAEVPGADLIGGYGPEVFKQAKTLADTLANMQGAPVQLIQKLRQGKALKASIKEAEEFLQGGASKPLPGQADLPQGGLTKAEAPPTVGKPAEVVTPPTIRNSRIVQPEATAVKPTATAVPETASPPAEPPNVPPTATGTVPPPPAQPGDIKGAVSEVVKALKEGQKLQAPTRAMQHEARSQRAAIANRYMRDKGLPVDEAMRRAKSAYSGKLPREGLTPPSIAPETQTFLRETVRDTPAIPDTFTFTRTTADDALQKVFAGELPTKGEIALLEEIFGAEIGNALRASFPGWEKFKQGALDILNIPRTLKASIDVSFPLRQGAWLTTRNPKQALLGVKKGLRAFVSEKYGTQVDELYRGSIEKGLAPDPDYIRSQEHGLFYAPYQKGKGALAGREELFTSKYAEKIPGIRQSERSYLTNSNVMRQEVWRKLSGYLDSIGAEKWEYDELAKLINYATGRGDLKQFNSLAPTLSTILFSPRMQAATMELPFMLASKSSAVRRLAAENIGATVGAGATILGLAALAGANVELDPRSSDFAKIRVGNTRIDIWGGKQQYNVALARLISGKGKSTETGKTYDIGPDSFAGDKISLLTHFVRGKLAPGPGLLTDIASGEDFLGNPMTKERVPEIALGMVSPMSPTQTYEGIKEDQTVGGLLSISGYLGAGVSSYGGPIAKLNREWLPDFKGYDAIPTDALEAKAKKLGSRDKYREYNPEVDAKLFVTGKVSNIKTVAAANKVRYLITENKIDPATIPGIKAAIASAEKTVSLGLEDENISPTDKLMISLGLVQPPTPKPDAKKQPNLSIEAEAVAIETDKRNDEAVIDRYYNATKDADNAYKTAWRKDHPEVDAAMALWGVVSTVQSAKAMTILKERAAELGIPESDIPALAKKSGGVPQLASPQTKLKSGLSFKSK